MTETSGRWLKLRRRRRGSRGLLGGAPGAGGEPPSSWPAKRVTRVEEAALGGAQRRGQPPRPSERTTSTGSRSRARSAAASRSRSLRRPCQPLPSSAGARPPSAGAPRSSVSAPTRTRPNLASWSSAVRIACSRSADTACSSAALAASERRPLAGAATRSPSAAKNLETAASRPARRKSRTDCSLDVRRRRRGTPETVTVGEGEARRARRELVPEPPDTEPGLALVRVVEQEHAPVAELGQPRRDVRSNGLVGVAAVDVKEIDPNFVGKPAAASSKLCWSKREKAP